MAKKQAGPRDFSKIGQVTWGNPNDYVDQSGYWLSQEALRRAKDDDEGGRNVAARLEEMREEAKEEGVTFLMYIGEGDCLIDLLSDCAPEGFEFDVRKWADGNHNAGYYPVGMKDEFQ